MWWLQDPLGKAGEPGRGASSICVIKHAAQMLVCTQNQKLHLHFKKCGQALHPAFVTSPRAVSVARCTDLTPSSVAPTAAVPTLQTPGEEGVRGPDWTEPVSPRTQLSSVFITEDLLCAWPG